MPKKNFQTNFDLCIFLLVYGVHFNFCWCFIMECFWMKSFKLLPFVFARFFFSLMYVKGKSFKWQVHVLLINWITEDILFDIESCQFKKEFKERPLIYITLPSVHNNQIVCRNGIITPKWNFWFQFFYDTINYIELTTKSASKILCIFILYYFTLSN